ncbi:unnamed protein product, partial [Staurois parvus]
IQKKEKKKLKYSCYIQKKIPRLQDTYTHSLPRPISSFQRCCILNDNCAVMQHCTHMKFL